jgi:hypothetical protein
MPRWLEEKNIKRDSILQEKQLGKDLGARLTPGSGNSFQKGDMKTGCFLIESKATGNKSISIKIEWLKKIEEEAQKENRLPLVILEIDRSRYFLFREKDIDLENFT